MSGLVLRAGDTAGGAYALDVTPERAGWRFSGLKVLRLEPGGSETLRTGPDEMVLLPLSGSCAVEVEDITYELAGRPDVFTAVTDSLYVPTGTTLTVTSAGGATLALPTARATRRRPVAYQGADGVRTELRGAGQASRQVNDYAMAGGLGTDRLLVCEVLTPGGNWSSYPPHKHDEHSEVERELEEIYYFAVRPGPSGPGVAYHRTYGTAGRPLDLLAEVRTGDVVLVPHGYHGPSMAAPGYDLYYLNVMAGPAEDRTWLMTDDPAHTWVRGTWESQDVDPRLPMTRPVEQGGPT
ncbi:5-deoxy-glucuronate isomerase [Georgenia satyanarayanai]|uniref:5-deoxy-glucuronate isomerase n=1 Tax=Georgenia satyanarayanai TaxID=860221 RepID=UPI002041D1C3|nr:5-deoxy-glucuronate isomerase [Georgenia satyanarayanai]MCM3661526.1 5-deoxy-glucuronate isomerase [Georgenia satyanarayanai]